MSEKKKRYNKAPNLKSPLRYPGGKAKLRHLVSRIVSASQRRPVLYIEPFAGGAGVALALLGDDVVDRIVLTDKDPMIGNFWGVVFGEQAPFEELYRWIKATNVSLDAWDEVRALQPETPVEYAFKCLFLSRTNFSGVLCPSAGPIGGRAQKSEYKINCRFNKSEILNRLLALRGKCDSVAFAGPLEYQDVQDLDAVVQCVQAEQSIFWYLDPPYFRKAEKLYNEKFSDQEHSRFKRWIDNDLQGDWLLSYDAVEEALDMWGKHDGLVHVDLLYTARAHDGGPACAPVTTREYGKEIFVSNVLVELDRRSAVLQSACSESRLSA